MRKGAHGHIRDLKWRLIGLVFVAPGVAVAWIFGLGPLREAQAGAKQVSYEIKAFVAAPFAVVIGLFLIGGGAAVGEMIGGPLAGRFRTATGGHKLLALAMLGVGAAASFLAWWWFDAELHRLGYVNAP